MKIELNNIGPFVEASVDIDGITVVAGENGTGKSTIGKTLYAMFNAFYLYKKHIKNKRVDNLELLIDNYVLSSFSNSYEYNYEEEKTQQFLEHIVEHLNEYLNDESKLKNEIIIKSEIRMKKI